MFEDETTAKYPQFVQHIKKNILPKKEEWAISERIENHLSKHNVNTTNYVEISFRITKYNQFNHVKTVRQRIDICNNRVYQIRTQNSRYLSKKCNIDPTKIVALDDDVPNSYLVPSERIEGKMYCVNMDLGLCECSFSMLRGPCKHKQIIATHFNLIPSDLIPEQDPRVRAFYHYLATGKQQNANWYRSLTQQDAIGECKLLSNPMPLEKNHLVVLTYFASCEILILYKKIFSGSWDVK